MSWFPIELLRLFQGVYVAAIAVALIAIIWQITSDDDEADKQK